MTTNRIWIVEDEAIIALDLKRRLETKFFVKRDNRGGVYHHRSYDT